MPDDYQLTITGTSGTLENQTAVTLTIDPADTDGDGVPDYWTLQYFGHITGQAGDLSRAGDDPDGDRMSNLAEYLCGTDPTDAFSYLHVLSATPTGADVLVSWAAIGGKVYVVESANNLVAANPFTNASGPLEIIGSGEIISDFLHIGGATNGPMRFYRIRLEP